MLFKHIIIVDQLADQFGNKQLNNKSLTTLREMDFIEKDRHPGTIHKIERHFVLQHDVLCVGQAHLGLADTTITIWESLRLQEKIALIKISLIFLLKIKEEYEKIIMLRNKPVNVTAIRNAIGIYQDGETYIAYYVKDDKICSVSLQLDKEQDEILINKLSDLNDSSKKDALTDISLITSITSKFSIESTLHNFIAAFSQLPIYLTHKILNSGLKHDEQPISQSQQNIDNLNNNEVSIQQPDRWSIDVCPNVDPLNQDKPTTSLQLIYSADAFPIRQGNKLIGLLEGKTRLIFIMAKNKENEWGFKLARIETDNDHIAEIFKDNLISAELIKHHYCNAELMLKAACIKFEDLYLRENKDELNEIKNIAASNRNLMPFIAEFLYISNNINKANEYLENEIFSKIKDQLKQLINFIELIKIIDNVKCDPFNLELLKEYKEKRDMRLQMKQNDEIIKIFDEKIVNIQKIHDCNEKNDIIRLYNQIIINCDASFRSNLYQSSYYKVYQEILTSLFKLITEPYNPSFLMKYKKNMETLSNVSKTASDMKIFETITRRLINAIVENVFHQLLKNKKIQSTYSNFITSINNLQEEEKKALLKNIKHYALGLYLEDTDRPFENIFSSFKTINEKSLVSAKQLMDDINSYLNNQNNRKSIFDAIGRSISSQPGQHSPQLTKK